MELKIVTPEGVFYQGEADEVYGPGVLGEFGVLKDHTSFFTPLKEGKLLVRSGGNERKYKVSKGFLEVSENKVTILADRVEEL